MWRTAMGAVALLLMGNYMSVHAAEFVDPLDEPAAMTTLAASSMVNAVAVAGNTLVAVGSRGHVLLSADDGKSWTQSPVPLSTDLVAVHFASPELGWAVGHDSVVIHTRDGGKSWIRQLDGRKALKILLSRYEQQAATDGRSAAILRSVKITMGQSAVEDCLPLPLLDVWFKNDKVGYVVGAFNLIFRTTDGGDTWEPWLHQVDNPREYNLHAVRGINEDVFIVGERGLVLKLDEESGRFAQVPVSYEGSFFGLIADPNYLVVYGMRGHAFLSADGGASFRQLELGTAQSIVGGGSLGGDRIALATQGGKLFVSDRSIQKLMPIALPPMAGVLGATTISPTSMVLATWAGVARANIKSTDLIGTDGGAAQTVAQHNLLNGNNTK